MGAFIAKQPNGKYCRFSSIVDCPTNWNMTEEDYIKLCMEKAKYEAIDILRNYLMPFEEVKDRFIPNNMTEAEFNVFLEDVSKPSLDVLEEDNNAR